MKDLDEYKIFLEHVKNNLSSFETEEPCAILGLAAQFKEFSVAEYPEADTMAYKLYQLAVQRGCIDALWELGLCYKYGKGVQENKETGFQYFLRAAKEDHGPAMMGVAFAYQHGIGVLKDDNLAVYWYKKAAKAGDASAMACLGEQYYSMHDYDNAYYWTSKAVKSGEPEGLLCLGKCYFMGHGTQKNLKKAEEAFLRCVKQVGWPEASFYLSKLYEEIGKTKESMKWLQRAADAGDTMAQVEMGEALVFGENIEQDIEKGIIYLEEAARKENGYAQTMLASVYYNDGNPLIDGPEKAFYWAEMAAQNGEELAQIALGCFLLDGFGCETDEKRGIELLTNLAGNGSEEAAKYLAEYMELNANASFDQYEGDR